MAELNQSVNLSSPSSAPAPLPSPRTNDGDGALAVGAEGGTEGGGRKVVLIRNPLEIPVIVKEVFLYLTNTVNIMKNLRVVSKLWRNECLDKWRDQAIFKVNSESLLAIKNTLLLQGQEEEPGPSSNNTNDQMDHPEIYRLMEKPFTHYKMCGEHTFPPSEQSPSYNDTIFFWENIGPLMTSLEFQEKTLFAINDGLHGLQFILRSAPNLEHLHIKPYDEKPIRVFRAEFEANLNEALQFELGRAGVRVELLSGQVEAPPGRYYGQREGEVVEEEEEEEEEEDEDPEQSGEDDDDDPFAAQKLKSLTISSSKVNLAEGQPIHSELFQARSNLVGLFLETLPNLKELRILDLTSYADALMGLTSLRDPKTGDLLPLELLHVQPSPFQQSPRSYFGNLPYYLRNVSPQQLKRLSLDSFHFQNFLQQPHQFREVLKPIRNSLEEIQLSFNCEELPLFDYVKFDLFNFRFPELTKIDVKFTYSIENDFYLSWDFNVFKGTPNLKYFRFDCEGVPSSTWLKRKLSAGDLENGGGREESWREYDNEGRRIDLGDENVEEDEVEMENPTVLEYLEEFHFQGGSLAPDALRLLGEWAGNLKVLEVFLDNETFPDPFEVWDGGKLKKVIVLSVNEDGVEQEMIFRQRERFPEIEIEEKVVVVEDDQLQRMKLMFGL